MRVFLLILSLLYVLGVNFARNVEFGAVSASPGCIASEDMGFSSRVAAEARGQKPARRITHEIIPRPDSLFGEGMGHISHKNELLLRPAGC